jgi:hypothetical protein
MMSETADEPWTVVEVKTASGLAYKIGSGEMLEVGKGCCIIYDDYPDARPSPRRKKADLIVTAVNAFEPMKKVLDDLLTQVIHWGDDSQLEAIAAEIKAAEDALRLAEGEKE